MNNLYTTVRRLRLVLAAAAVLGLLVLPSAASAKRNDRTRDRNHDGIPDKWEKRHHISTKKRGMGKADPDGDGLKNRAEWRARTNPRLADTDGDGVGDASEDPDRDQVDNGNEARERTKPRRADSDRDGVKDGREDADDDRLNNAGEDESGNDPINPDTDGDGVEDGDEFAGKIVSFDGTTLTISVFGGSTITGTVDEDTYIDCGDESSDDSGGDLGQDSGDESDAEGYDEAVGYLGDDSSARLDGSRFGGDDAGSDDGSADGSDDEGADDPGADDGWDDGSDDGSDETGGGGDEGADIGGGCSIDTLTVGAVVNQASITATSDGTFFDEIELAQ
jgi:hypothetical protein